MMPGSFTGDTGGAGGEGCCLEVISPYSSFKLDGLDASFKWRIRLEV